MATKPKVPRVVPWDQIEAEYIGSTITVVALARKYGVTETALRSRVKRGQWDKARLETRRNARKCAIKSAEERIQNSVELNVTAVLVEMNRDVEDYRQAERVLKETLFEVDKEGRPTKVRKAERLFHYQGSVLHEPAFPEFQDIRAMMQAMTAANEAKYRAMGMERDMAKLDQGRRQAEVVEVLAAIKTFEDVPAALRRLVEINPEAAKNVGPVLDAMYKHEVFQYTKAQGLSRTQFGKLLEELGGIVTTVMGDDADKLEEFQRRWSESLDRVLLGVTQ